eukprot:TRINITY_DN8522_c0_g1_i1.p1 TRINITY_DN8522_c0_g1~~TRINITY_DN8522_c0_g1_i1.p1  ORF type:complete len:144 (+),score=26.09 TRINITY_DN8522_c0_g1_i1:36-434(+)
MASGVEEEGKPNGNVVDVISMSAVYEELPFDNAEGGVWRQGWPLEYRGDEWDDERLQIFVVPHSHNDPGWLMTVDEYYSSKTRHIIDTIVLTLSRRYWDRMRGDGSSGKRCRTCPCGGRMRRRSRGMTLCAW